MATIIKVNGQTITIANKSEESFNLEAAQKEVSSIENMSSAITASIEALNLIADTKAMESFGYQSTEAVSEKLRTAGKKIIEKLKDFWEKVKKFVTETVPKFFKDLFNKISKFMKGEFDVEKYANQMCESQKGLALYEAVVFDGKDTVAKLVGKDVSIEDASVVVETVNNLSKCDNVETVKSKISKAGISGDKFRHDVADKFERLSKNIESMCKKFDLAFKAYCELAEENEIDGNRTNKVSVVLQCVQKLSVMVCDIQSKSANAFLNSNVTVGANTKIANAGKVAVGYVGQGANRFVGTVGGAKLSATTSGIATGLDGLAGDRQTKLTKKIGKYADEMKDAADFVKDAGKDMAHDGNVFKDHMVASQRDKEFKKPKAEKK